MLKRSNILALGVAGTAFALGLAVLFVPTLSNSIAASRTKPMARSVKSPGPVRESLGVRAFDPQPEAPSQLLTADGN